MHRHAIAVVCLCACMSAEGQTSQPSQPVVASDLHQVNGGSRGVYRVYAHAQSAPKE